MAPPPTVNPFAVRMPAEGLAGAMPSGGATTMATGAAQRQDRVLASDHTEAVHGSETSAALGELVDALKTTTIGLRFEIDEATHRVITKVIDKETGDLIRQMPTEEVLRIARAIDKLQGLFINQAA
ncbi:flagellar protein FlaG [Cupriavidus alkaliphilus]|uniref:flagellar protein FlaG n=1 Tax=Cupriavidus alkaliphilus TaxID=942866 RepID=UPI001617C1F4|nr:flagellar protein FlaG [Cupriavidus alkaliphilus]MBB2919706.1 flagellar protein FlaG [Cupriavidus alkaliphilus]